MTFDQLVTEVLQRTRQTSAEATTRIGREINDRNRRVTSSIGLQTSRRVEAVTVTIAGDPIVTFDVEKLLDVFMDLSANRRMLGERTFDSWRSIHTNAPSSGPPQTYAIARMLPGQVELVLDPVPDAIYTLKADGLVVQTTLAADDVPTFSTDFHDVLMHGALADEWTQLQQKDLATRAEGMYEARLSDLRMFIAKSGYLAITQGQRGGFDRGDYLPGYYIPRWW